MPNICKVLSGFRDSMMNMTEMPLVTMDLWETKDFCCRMCVPMPNAQ